MDPFSYLSFLTSIVLGLGIARLLVGLGRLLQARGRIRLYSVHLVWALNVLLFLTLNWWILFRWHTQTDWNFFLFLFLLLTPTIAFLLTVLLFPEPLPDGADMREHFYANQRWFFSISALLPLLDAADTLLKGVEHFRAQGSIYPAFLTIAFVLMVVASRTRRPGFHAFFSVFFLLYLLAFIALNLRLLN